MAVELGTSYTPKEYRVNSPLQLGGTEKPSENTLEYIWNLAVAAISVFVRDSFLVGPVGRAVHGKDEHGNQLTTSARIVEAAQAVSSLLPTPQVIPTKK